MHSLGCTILLTVLISNVLLASNWPQWRGPSADGLSPDKNMPAEWSTDRNIAWKAKLPGLGTSTPIVWDDWVILTSQIGDGPVEGRSRDFAGSPSARKSGAQDQVRFAVQAYSRRDGKLAWEYIFEAEGDTNRELPPAHSMHNLASPSCVTDGRMVYAWVATGQLVALDMQGKLVWKRHLGRDYSHFVVLWGHGSSPLLYRDRLILLCDHKDASYLLALEARTGKEIWKADRGKNRRSYATPFVIPGAQSDEIVINSSERIDVYDPNRGELLWYVGRNNQVPVPTPVWHDQVLYTSRGYNSGPYFAVETGVAERGDASARIKWEVKTGAPYVSSLLYYQGVIYMASESGVGTAVDAADGKTLWKERLGGVFTASPVAGDGKVYWLNEEGEAFVLQAGCEFKVLSRNKLEERTLASPAIAGGQIFIRGDDHLFCIGSQPAPE